MGNCAENTAKKYKITREEQDEFAILSYKRAQEAWSKGLFSEEIVEVTVKGKKGDTVVKEDEGYNRLKLDKVPTLKPAFDRSGSGTVTAANSSSFNDGASAVVLGNREVAKKYGKGKKVLARIVATADAAVDPIDFPIAPAKVVPLVLERAGLKKSDIKIWEFNEAFAAVIRANAKVCCFTSRLMLKWHKWLTYTYRSWNSAQTMSTREEVQLLSVTRLVVQERESWSRCCINCRRGSMDARRFAMVVVRPLVLSYRLWMRMTFEAFKDFWRSDSGRKDTKGIHVHRGTFDRPYLLIGYSVHSERHLKQAILWLDHNVGVFHYFMSAICYVSTI